MKVLDRGTIYYTPYDRYGYFAWPTVTANHRTIYVACSGFRQQHQGDRGKAVLLPILEEDLGKRQAHPIVLEDSTDEDIRDCGIACINNLLWINWYTAEGNSRLLSWNGKGTPPPSLSLSHRSSHGAFRYGGAPYMIGLPKGQSTVDMISLSNSRSLTRMAYLPGDNHEPHGHYYVRGGILFAGIRHDRTFSSSIYSSLTNGETWNHEAYLYGAPPHITTHGSRLLISVTYRCKPYGVVVYETDVENYKPGTALTDFTSISLDSAQPNEDCGYPSTITLSDKSLLTVYYGRSPGWSSNHHLPGILYVRWTLDD